MHAEEVTGNMQPLLARSAPIPPELPAREYLEPLNAYEVHNRYLRLGLAAAGALVLMLGAALFKTSTANAHLKPLVIRINEFGEPSSSTYAATEYQPHEAEVKHFLINFVQDHYSRNRSTLSDFFTRQLYFLDANQARAITEENARTKWIQNYLTSSDDEVDIVVHNVAIEDLRQAPYKAAVDFEKVYHSLIDHRETRRERYVAHVVFTVLNTVPGNFVQVNPLGLVITYFREDQAF
jgi:type IV secretory pathway TrbF-like protein